MSDTLSVTYSGRFARLFGLSLSTLTLTILTLGIYRFWMKARLRRYYWASVQPGGVPMEYHGTGVEKLLGFLVAAIFLAIYLLILNIVLSFVGIAFFAGNPVATVISFVAVLPLIFFARYRARRYILSRTRWRGLRFGVEPVAFEYMWLALGHTILTVLTLGLLYPRQHFKLEKFVTDRTWYGDLRLVQNGTWSMLFRPWLVVLGGIVLLIGGFVQAAATGDPENLIFLPLLFPVIVFGLVFYSVTSFRTLTAHKQAGHHVRFQSRIRTGRVLRIYVLGTLALSVILILSMTALLAIGWVYFAALDINAGNLGNLLELPLDGPAGWAGVGFSVFSYFFLMLVLSTFAETLFVQPLIRHYAVETTILNASEIEFANQRPHDAAVEAEGFADALDVGAAI